MSRTSIARAMLTTLLVWPSLLWAQSNRSATGPREQALPGWRTDTAQRTINLRELKAGGPGKDGIPAIQRPRFVNAERAAPWLGADEPVISLVVNGQSKAYPLQILMWHEIINDTIAEIPVAVTFCPLCYSAEVFDRRAKGQTLTFGISGFLRLSNMVMYDKQTESLWQQGLGQAVVGSLTGTRLKRLPAQIISFAQFRQAYPKGRVLSRRTGHNRPYGRNPYVGYDSISQNPLTIRPDSRQGVLPRERLVAVTIAGRDKAYPYSTTRKLGVVNDEVGTVPLVVFHGDGALSAMDQGQIASSREVGSTGVFDRRMEGQVLTFEYTNGRFRDTETSSTWDITGKAVEGPMKGKQLKPIGHSDYFAFSWLVFRPGTQIFTPSSGAR